MSTIATLNLPASTSGIWTLAPPWAAPALQLVAAPDAAGDPPPPGVVEHAVTASNPANRVLANLNRRLTIDLLLLDVGPRCARRASSGDCGWPALPGASHDVGPGQDRCAERPRAYSSAGAESRPWS